MNGAAAAPLTVAGCRLGPVRFAVAMGDVQQLLHRPERLTVLPRREGALLGAVQVRNAMLPVVDLRRWLPWPDDGPGLAPAAAPLLLVLRRGAQSLAVAIDAVDGLRRVGPAGAQALAHGAAGDELFSSVVQPLLAPHQAAGADAPVALLDVAALMRLSQVWAHGPDASADPTAGVAAQDRSAQPSAHTVACALLDCEGERLAIPATQLRAVLPMPPLQTLWGGDPFRLGVARWRSRDVPVLRLLPSLGICAATPQAPPLLAVVEHAGCCMGIPVLAVCDVRRMDVTGAQGVTALGIADTGVLTGVLTLDDGQRALLLDVAALVAQDPLAALSTVREADTRTAAGGTPAHVVVRAAGPWALPLAQVLEILELPPGWTAGPDAGTPWRHTWRQQALPLWDLRALLGHGPSAGGAAAKLLVVQTGASSGEQTVGLVVEELLHLLPARTAELHQLPRGGGRSVPFLVHRSGGSQHSFAVLADADWTQALPH